MAHLYSDCGTNFIGANNVLESITKQLPPHLANTGIQWHFNPPAAPHFGGLWEAGVKSVKAHLKRTLGASLLTYEELYTLLTEVEACVNSRPLSPISSSEEEWETLTPGHFLIGGPLISVPDLSYPDERLHLLSRWKRIQARVQQFWRGWQRDYLQTLQQRGKWRTSSPNLQPGDLVLLLEDNQQPMHWPLARVSHIHPGKDGLVRTVTVITAQGSFKRPIQKLSPLPKLE
jgi:hypothetical protein